MGLGGLFPWCWAKANGGPVSWVRFGFVVITGHQAALGPHVPGLMQSQSWAEGNARIKDRVKQRGSSTSTAWCQVSLHPPVGGSQVVVGQRHLSTQLACAMLQTGCACPVLVSPFPEARLGYIKGRYMVAATKLCCQAQQWFAMNGDAEALGTQCVVVAVSLVAALPDRVCCGGCVSWCLVPP